MDNLEYTLQRGREAMTERLAIVARSREDLGRALRAHLAGEASDDALIFAGRTARSTSVSAQPQPPLDATTREATELARLAREWVVGGAIDWHTLPSDQTARRCSLPTYPFERRRFWLPDVLAESSPADAAVDATSLASTNALLPGE